MAGRELESATDTMKKVLPKYAFWVPTGGAAEEERLGNKYMSQYGNVFAVLKPHVKDRATFTPFDSLVGYYGLNYSGELHPHVRTPKNPPADSLEIRKKKGWTEMYWEAQVWGELTVQSDVDYFLWSCWNSPRDQPELLAKLKATGKPVYECMKSADPSQKPGYITYSRFRRGKQL